MTQCVRSPGRRQINRRARVALLGTGWWKVIAKRARPRMGAGEGGLLWPPGRVGTNPVNTV